MKQILSSFILMMALLACDTSHSPVDESAILKVNDKNFQEKVLASDQVILVDFYADWCGPCQQLNPIIAALAKQYEGKAVIAKVNVDEARDVSFKYQVSSIPRLILFKNGKMIKNVEARDLGALSKEIEVQLY